MISKNHPYIHYTRLSSFIYQEMIGNSQCNFGKHFFSPEAIIADPMESMTIQDCDQANPVPPGQMCIRSRNWLSGGILQLGPPSPAFLLRRRHPV